MPHSRLEPTAIVFPAPDSRPTALAIAPSETLALIATDSGIVGLWDLASGECLDQFDDDALPPPAVAFSSDGQRIAIARADGRLHVAPVDAGADTEEQTPSNEPLRCVDFDRDGKTLVALSEADRLIVWSVTDRSTIRTIIAPRDLRCVAIAPDASLIAAGHDDGRVSVWSTSDGSLVLEVEASATAITALAIGEASKRIAVGAADGSVHILAKEGDRRPVAFEGLGGGVRAIRFAPDGVTLFASDSEGRVLGWDTESATRTTRLDPRPTPIDVMAVRGACALLGGGKDVSLWRIVDENAATEQETEANEDDSPDIYGVSAPISTPDVRGSRSNEPSDATAIGAAPRPSSSSSGPNPIPRGMRRPPEPPTVESSDRLAMGMREFRVELIVLGVAFAIGVLLLFPSLHFWLGLLIMFASAAAAGWIVYRGMTTPIRATPEDAIRQFYRIPSERLPSYRRMYDYLTPPARKTPEFATFEAFEAYWTYRIRRLVPSSCMRRPPSIQLLNVRIEHVPEDRAAEASFTISLAPNAYSSPTAEIPMSARLYCDSEGFWRLADGRLPDPPTEPVDGEEKKGDGETASE